nr:tetratricopeptide repeat protein [Clostridioides sp.]
MINILGIDFIEDIKNMKVKELDVNLIERNDLTFFKVKNEEEDKISKILLESLITENIKKETLDSLEFTASDDIKEISDEKIIKSYELYNNALSLAAVNYITGAEKLIDKAYNIYKRDVDILNLRGIIKLLKCDFSQAFNSFYISLAKDDMLSKKYIDMFKTEDFEVFLERYNHAVRFINEGLNYEAIEILENIIEEEPEFINPYVMLSLIFNRIEKQSKSNLVLDKLKFVDRDNDVVQKRSLELEEEEERKINAVSKHKNGSNVESKKVDSFKLVIGISIVTILAIVFVYNNNNKINDLNEKLNKKEQKLNMLEDKINKNKDGNNNDKSKNEISEEKKEIKKLTNKEENDYFENALKLRKVEDYKGAINYFEKIVDSGNRKKYISESMYQLAVLNSKLKNNDEAIKYYKKYIDTYSKDDTYYDDSYYELGMLYYENGDLKNAKKTFYSLKSEVPNSMYNNSKVKEILKES